MKRPETAADRRPEAGDIMIWVGKAGRLADCPVHRVMVCGVPQSRLYGYLVKSDETGGFHHATGRSLLWPESLCEWLRILMSRPPMTLS